MMKDLRVLRIVQFSAILLAVVFAAGCGGDKKSDKESSSSDSSSKLGDTLPDLDGGRLTLAGPKGWDTAPRKSSYVVKFNNPNQEGESVYVRAEDCSSDIKTLSEENAAELIDALGKRAKDAKINTYDGITCVRYMYTSRDDSYLFSNIVYTTVQYGRQYDFFYRIPQNVEQFSTPSLIRAIFKSAKFSETASETADEATDPNFSVSGDFGGETEEPAAE